MTDCSSFSCVCAVEAALQGAPGADADLEILRVYRDRVMSGSPAGRRYIKAFYRHAAEAASLMTRDVSLRTQTADLLRRLLVRSASTGQELRWVLTRADVAEIKGMLSRVRPAVSSELRETLNRVEADLDRPDVFRQLNVRVTNPAER